VNHLFKSGSKVNQTENANKTQQTRERDRKRYRHRQRKSALTSVNYIKQITTSMQNTYTFLYRQRIVPSETVAVERIQASRTEWWT